MRTRNISHKIHFNIDQADSSQSVSKCSLEEVVTYRILQKSCMLMKFALMTTNACKLIQLDVLDWTIWKCHTIFHIKWDIHMSFFCMAAKKRSEIDLNRSTYFLDLSVHRMSAYMSFPKDLE